MAVSLTEVGNESTVYTNVNNHISHVHKKYKDTVVFSDGCGETLSTKHQEHARRTKGKTGSADLNIAPNMLISCDRDLIFFSI